MQCLVLRYQILIPVIHFAGRDSGCFEELALSFTAVQEVLYSGTSGWSSALGEPIGATKPNACLLIPLIAHAVHSEQQHMLLRPEASKRIHFRLKIYDGRRCQTLATGRLETTHYGTNNPEHANISDFHFNEGNFNSQTLTHTQRFGLVHTVFAHLTFVDTS